MKFKTWDGEDINEPYVLSVKIDGVRAHRKDGQWLSRANKPLYNLPDLDDGIYEVYLGNFKDTISAVKTHKGNPIHREFLYRLDSLDDRLFLQSSPSITKEDIKDFFKTSLEEGYEGLIIKTEDCYYKVKSEETYDVEITGYVEGKGKYKDSLGALYTTKGKVGTGFTDQERRDFWRIKESLSGTYIEVSCMSLTEEGKFRHPRFIRERWDK